VLYCTEDIVALRPGRFGRNRGRSQRVAGLVSKTHAGLGLASVEGSQGVPIEGTDVID
jgi:hypothetical protein